MGQHTPGPWVVDFWKPIDGVDARVRSVRGHSIATLFHQENGEANARLIAAAPDLLDALKDLVALYEASPGHDPAFVAKGQAAIAKAEGR